MYAEKKMVLILLKFCRMLQLFVVLGDICAQHIVSPSNTMLLLPVIGFSKNLSILFYLNLLGQYVTTIQPCKGYGV